MRYKENAGTEILATMGPSLGDETQIRHACSLGAENFRIHMGVRKNLCYQYFANVRAVEEKIHQHLSVLLDLPTAKPRIGKIRDFRPVTGERYVFSPASVTDDDKVLPLNALDKIYKALKPGHRINFSDGKVLFSIVSVNNMEVTAECTKSCTDLVSNISSCVFPDSDAVFDLFCDGDYDLFMRLRNSNLFPDWVAISFADDCSRINEVKNIVCDVWNSNVKIMAKIETVKGLQNFQKILDCVDGIMVARGDLLSFVEPYKLPHIQQTLVQMTRTATKTSVVATEMLEQFSEKGVVSRPELTDIATAVRQGASAVMLSKESANSIRAFDCISLMKQIINYEEAQKKNGSSKILA